MKYRGGVGIDISSLRPSNATVQNSAKTSSGSASFTDLFSQVTNIIGQNNRRGALMLSISINHPDVEEFILVKQDLTKVTGANMSVKVTNEFMEAVENNEDYILTYPIDQRLKPSDVEGYKEYNKLYLNPYGPGFFKRIKALELWNKLIHCAWNTAEPGIIFEDHHNNYSPDSVYEDYKFISTNPCGEIAMQPYDSCRLIHHNFTSFIIGELYTDSAEINWEFAYDQFYIGMILGDILID